MQYEIQASGVNEGTWRVFVFEGQLQCDARPLPYATWIGTIDHQGVINPWKPAGSVPRGYKRARDILLAEIRSSAEFQAKVSAYRIGCELRQSHARSFQECITLALHHISRGDFFAAGSGYQAAREWARRFYDADLRARADTALSALASVALEAQARRVAR